MLLSCKITLVQHLCIWFAQYRISLILQVMRSEPILPLRKERRRHSLMIGLVIFFDDLSLLNIDSFGGLMTWWYHCPGIKIFVHWRTNSKYVHGLSSMHATSDKHPSQTLNGDILLKSYLRSDQVIMLCHLFPICLLCNHNGGVFIKTIEMITMRQTDSFVIWKLIILQISYGSIFAA